MSLPAEFIDNLPVPRCPYCGAEMYACHRKTWCGMNWHYLAAEFRCNGSETSAQHSIVIRARTVSEWEKHKNKLKFLVCSGKTKKADGAVKI